MGPESNTNERIVLQAARWHARLAAHDCTVEERAEFARWRQRDPAHAEVYAATEALSAALGHAASIDDRLHAMADEAFAMGANDVAQGDCVGTAGRRGAHAKVLDGAVSSTGVAHWPQRRWYVPAALAASVLVAFVALRLAQLADPAALPAVAFAAPAESRRDVTLSDGSIVHLDVGSQISVRMSAGERDIVLVDGRALFDVAHDTSRPSRWRRPLAHHRARHALPGSALSPASARDARRRLGGRYGRRRPPRPGAKSSFPASRSASPPMRDVAPSAP
jgi:transmembrane sensor